MTTNLNATAPNRWSGLKSHFFFTMWPHVNTTVATFFVNIGIKMSSLTHFHGVFFLIIGKAFDRFVEKLVENNPAQMWEIGNEGVANNEGYFTLKNSSSQKVLTAVSARNLEMKGTFS